MTYFWYPAKASFVRCFAGMASLPKIGRERERDPKPYPSKQEKRTHGRTKWIGICYGMGKGIEKKH